MMTRVPFEEPTSYLDTYHDEPDGYELPSIYQEQTSFQWPPEWLMPLIKFAWLRCGSEHAAGEKD
jgi:hypothetical protein